ncbi:MAG: hypothetical protein ACP5RI_01700 [Candidatus Micrarchaeia archaeon]
MFSTYFTLIIPALIAFIGSMLAVPFVKSYMLESGVISIDNNKKNKPILPASGGIAVAFGFIIGLLAYIFGASYHFYVPVASQRFIFATALSVAMIVFVGFLDDINVKKKAVKTTGMKDIRKGLKQWQKPLFTFIGAIPLMVIAAGTYTVDLPFVGVVNFGIFYPLVIIPLAIIFVTNAFNILGGFDGIATGSALILSLALLIYAFFFGTYTGILLSAILFASLLAFLPFTIYPAKILPGDTLYFGIGAAFVAIIIVGNMEAFGIIVFIPWIVEFVLHLRKKFDVTDLGKLRSDGTFEPPYGKKIYSWTHLIMNMKRCKEWEVSLYMWIIEVGFVVLAFALKLIGLL